MTGNQYWEGKAQDFITRDVWKDSDEYKIYLDRELGKIDDNDHKEIFIDTALKKLDSDHTEHLVTCTTPGNTGRCLECYHYPKIKYITELALKKIKPLQSFAKVATRVDSMEKIEQREYEFLLRLFRKGDLSIAYDMLQSSELYVKRVNKYVTGISVTTTTLVIKVDPEGYIKSYERGALDIKELGKIIGREYQKIVDFKVDAVETKPEMNKFQILPNAIKPILTGWDEINKGQEELIEQLSQAEKETDYQNVGNTSRTLMQKLSNIVFDPEKHKAPPAIDLSEGKFRNRFHAFIKTELATEQNEEMRDYINSMIETTEHAVDLSNKTTHDLKAFKLMAECCVIGVITVVKFISLLHEHKLNSK